MQNTIIRRNASGTITHYAKKIRGRTVWVLVPEPRVLPANVVIVRGAS